MWTGVLEGPKKAYLFSFPPRQPGGSPEPQVWLRQDATLIFRGWEGPPLEFKTFHRLFGPFLDIS